MVHFDRMILVFEFGFGLLKFEYLIWIFFKNVEDLDFKINGFEITVKINGF